MRTTGAIVPELIQTWKLTSNIRSFIGDAFNLAFTPSELFTNEIIPKNVSSLASLISYQDLSAIFHRLAQTAQTGCAAAPSHDIPPHSSHPFLRSNSLPGAPAASLRSASASSGTLPSLARTSPPRCSYLPCGSLALCTERARQPTLASQLHRLARRAGRAVRQICVGRAPPPAREDAHRVVDRDQRHRRRGQQRMSLEHAQLPGCMLILPRNVSRARSPTGRPSGSRRCRPTSPLLCVSSCPHPTSSAARADPAPRRSRRSPHTRTASPPRTSSSTSRRATARPRASGTRRRRRSRASACPSTTRRCLRTSPASRARTRRRRCSRSTRTRSSIACSTTTRSTGSGTSPVTASARTRRTFGTVSNKTCSSRRPLLIALSQTRAIPRRKYTSCSRTNCKPSLRTAPLPWCKRV